MDVQKILLWQSANGFWRDDMKKIKLSPSLKKKSTSFLTNYLTKERKRPLTLKVKRQIKKQIGKNNKNLDNLTVDIINSPLFTLAVAEIIREGHSEKITLDGQQKYDIDPAEIMIMMLKIVDVANKQGQKKQLEDYCRRPKC